MRVCPALRECGAVATRSIGQVACLVGMKGAGRKQERGQAQWKRTSDTDSNMQSANITETMGGMENADVSGTPRGPPFWQATSGCFGHCLSLAPFGLIVSRPPPADCQAKDLSAGPPAARFPSQCTGGAGKLS